MRRVIPLLLAGCCLASCATVAPAGRDGAHRDLGDLDIVISRIESDCPARFSAALAGAADAVNALPQRAGLTPVDGRAPDPFRESFAEAAAAGDAPALRRAAIDGAVAAVDARSAYIDADTFRSMMDQDRELSIGLRLHEGDPAPVIVQVAREGPAGRAGLRRGDRLLSVDGRSTAGMPIDEVNALLRGEASSMVALSIGRKGAAGPIPVELRHEIVMAEAMPSVEWRTDGRVGIVTIARLDEKTATRAEEAIRAIQYELGAPQGYVIDVRWNGGGLLDQVVSLADLFLDGGPVLVVSGIAPCGDGERDVYNARPDDLTGGAPVVLLVNHETASGAELFAAALIERGRAQAIGQRTYGRGDVQTVIPLNGGRSGVLRLTVGELLTPGGRRIEGAGVEPDIVVPEEEPGRDYALERAMELLNAPGGVTPTH